MKAERVIYFGTSSCPQCKVWKPKYEEKCKALGLTFQYVDADGDDDTLVNLYRVRNIPFVVIESGGQAVETGLAAKLFGNLDSYDNK